MCEDVKSMVHSIGKRVYYLKFKLRISCSKSEKYFCTHRNTCKCKAPFSSGHCPSDLWCCSLTTFSLQLLGNNTDLTLELSVWDLQDHFAVLSSISSPVQSQGSPVLCPWHEHSLQQAQSSLSVCEDCDVCKEPPSIMAHCSAPKLFEIWC